MLKVYFITTFKGTNLAQWSCVDSYECCACAFQVHCGARQADPHDDLCHSIGVERQEPTLK